MSAAETDHDLYTSRTETEDAERVEQARQFIDAGELNAAEIILKDVITNVPEVYHNAYQIDGEHYIKSWTLTDFQYDTALFSQFVPGKNLIWMPNAYPRAFFYLGFIAVERKRPQDALHYLDLGLQLESDNTSLLIEKAQALASMRRFDEAMAVYDQVIGKGLMASGKDRAIAYRGKGFIEIESDALVMAAFYYLKSLEFQPDNELAQSQLAYIRHLQSGGRKAGKGTMRSDESALAAIARLQKKWWQFWK